MTVELAQFSEQLSIVGTLSLWVAVLLRAPAGLRSPPQRGLWLAVATAAAAMTLALPAVGRFAVETGAPNELVGLTRNLCGVISAGAVLYFVTTASGIRRLRVVLCGIIATVVVLMMLAVAGASSHLGTPVSAGLPPLARTYWLVVCGTHIFANTACIIVCWTGARSDVPAPLRVSLQLFALGTLFAGAYWLGQAVRLFIRADWIVPLLPIVMAVHALLRAAAILVPTAISAARTITDFQTAWRLWPLWRDVTEAVPHVVLTDVRSRLMEFLWPVASWKLLAYRKVIETRDSMLVLYKHADPNVLDSAQQFVGAAGIPEHRREAAVLACTLTEALRDRRAGRIHNSLPQALVGHDSGSLADERVFLLDLAKEYQSPLVRRFAVASSDRTAEPPAGRPT